MRKGETQIFIMLGFLGLLFLMPLSGDGADLTISNVITGNGNMTLNGTMSATSFSGSGSGLTNLPAGAIAFYGNVAVVAPIGGDYNNPATAMGAYGSWCGTPSATYPCLLKIMPGVYDIAGSTVVMQPYIDIEGSGQNVTVITGTVGSGSWPPSNGVVNGANNAEIRFLTVKNTGSGSCLAAILNSSASPAMTNVTAKASGATNFKYGVFNNSSSPTMTNVTVTASGGTAENYGVYNYSSSSPTMTNVTATASAGTAENHGVYNYFSSPTMTNVTASGSGGTNNYGVESTTSGTIRINHSVIKGATNTVKNGSGVTTYVGNTQLDGGPVSNSGTLTCAGVYDETYNFNTDTCP